MSIHNAEPAILSLATGVPRYGASQEEMLRFFTRAGASSLPADKRARWGARLRHLYASSRISRRYSVLPDYLADDPQNFEFFPRNWRLDPFPSTAERMRVFKTASVDLAERVSRQALDEAGVSTKDVTHIVICTCTGFFAPGPDVELIDRLGLPSSTQRTIIGFMGCHAGFNGLRVSQQISQADPDARVLQVCVELCSLHMQRGTREAAALANCLFADGCAALIVGRGSEPSHVLGRLSSFASLVETSGADQMAWDIGDTGFEMRLASQVPDTLRRQIAPFVDSLLYRAGMTIEDVAHWGIHPGGPRILTAVAEALGLSTDAVDPSSSVLRDYGNMSSPTIFFILQRVFERAHPGPVVLLGFGPGLTVEGTVLHAVRPQTGHETLVYGKAQ